MRITDLTGLAAKRGAVVALAAGAVVAGTATAAVAGNQDGGFNTGEFVVYQSQSFLGGVYDTVLTQIPSYPAINAKYVNLPTTINDSPESTKNGKNVRIYLWEASFCGGNKITHLGYLETPTPVTSWAYTSLGSMNNKASGHSAALSC